MVTDADVWSSLATGDIEVQGRLPGSSNGALLVTTTADGRELAAVYKPIAFEQPLWDFPEMTLGRREVAARVLDSRLWNLVPETVWRESGPMGPGMCQVWIESDPVDFVKVFRQGQVPTGWLPVLSALDQDDNPVVVAHPDSIELRRVALFDVLANNADRKAGHLLARQATEGLFSVDHGLTFNTEPKLRTVLWGFAGESIAADLLEPITRVLNDSELDAQLRELLADEEVDGFRTRAHELLASARYPGPPQDRNPIPWPLV